MQPAAICIVFLGQAKLTDLLTALSSPQLKSILRSGGVRAKVSGGIVSQQKRKRIWVSRISDAVVEDNQDAASEFLQQWLLNHRRAMLIDYLEGLGVAHRAGETDSSFLLVTDAARVKEHAYRLLESYPPDEAKAYLAYVAHQQKATVFDDWEPLQASEPATEQQP